MMLHDVKMSKLNQLQLKLKKGSLPRSEMNSIQYPAPEGKLVVFLYYSYVI